MDFGSAVITGGAHFVGASLAGCLKRLLPGVRVTAAGNLNVAAPGADRSRHSSLDLPES